MTDSIKNGLAIREAGQRDASRIAKLHAASWRSAYRGILTDVFLNGPVEDERLQVWKERFSTSSKPMFVLIVESNRQSIGLICVFPEADATCGSFVDNLHVVPSFTGRGIGRHLLSIAASRLLADGHSSGVFLWVLEKNERACRFYEQVHGIHTDSAVHLMPDGQSLPARRYHWSKPASLVL
jgi:hypothetical protein